MSDTIVVIGSHGQLATDLIRIGRQQGRTVIGLDCPEIDITNMPLVGQALNPLAPPIVINTAAAHGAAQATFQEQQPFFNVNALGVWNLARWCSQHGATLIHYSTDYVFGAERSRNKPYTEADAPCPTNIYGASKVAGELLVHSFCSQHYILRVASLYGAAGCRAKGDSNFVKMTLGKIQKGENMKVVNDQFMSPTWTGAAARKTFELLDARAPFGSYHLAGSGTCTWYEFAREIVRLAGGKITVEPAATPADKPDDIFLRPRYTALDNANLRRAGLADLPHWRLSLEDYLQNEQKLQ